MRQVTLAAAATLCFAIAAPLSAQTPPPPAQGPSNAAPPQPQTSSMPTPHDGREFGQHVSGMAPEHPKDHGVMFGECVSALATTGDCPHHDEEEDE